MEQVNTINIIKVGIAELKIASFPDILATYGLGSCVAVCLYDAKSKIGGLSHFMLPDSTCTRNLDNLAKFGDSAICLLCEKMVKAGAVRRHLKAKLVGGASMFKFLSKTINMGLRNIEIAHKELEALNIPIIAEAVGGNYGRSVKFYTDTGIVYVHSLNKGDKTI